LHHFGGPSKYTNFFNYRITTNLVRAFLAAQACHQTRQELDDKHAHAAVSVSPGTTQSNIHDEGLPRATSKTPPSDRRD